MIYIVHHTPMGLPSGDFLRPFHTGVDDREGDGIPDEDAFAEMRCHYWVWRNAKTPWVGFQHYRRAFFSPLDDPFRAVFAEPHTQVFEVKPELVRLSALAFAKNMCNYKSVGGIIVPRPLVLGELMGRHYSRSHNPQDWEIFAPIAERAGLDMRISILTAFNMFVMRWDLFDEYMTLWWRVMSEAREKIILPTEGWQRKVFAFLSERLFTAWLSRLQCERPTLRVVTLPVLVSERV